MKFKVSLVLLVLFGSTLVLARQKKPVPVKTVVVDVYREEDVKQRNALLAPFMSSEKMSEVDALEMLDLKTDGDITNRDIKKAYRAKLREFGITRKSMKENPELIKVRNKLKQARDVLFGEEQEEYFDKF